jgi:hypothetical protein
MLSATTLVGSRASLDVTTMALSRGDTPVAPFVGSEVSVGATGVAASVAGGGLGCVGQAKSPTASRHRRCDRSMVKSDSHPREGAVITQNHRVAQVPH